MTKSHRGSSLPQARSYHHNHYHLHNRRDASPENAPHQHHRRQTDEPDPSPTPEPASSTVASRRVVVQTVSLIQVVDESGTPIEVQTRYAPLSTADSSSSTSSPSPSPSTSTSASLGLSIAAVSSESSTTAATTTTTTSDITSESSSSTSNDSSQSIPSATTPSTTPSSTPSPSSASSGSASGSSASQDIPLTSDPLTSPPASSALPSLYPSLSAAPNSTIREPPFAAFLMRTERLTGVFSIPYLNKLIFNISPYRNHFNEPVFVRFNKRNVFSAFVTLVTFFNLRTNSFATSTSTGFPETTAGGDGSDGGVGGVGGGGSASPTSTSTSNNTSSDDSAPSTGTVVGSVVGSIAGVAFLVLLAFLALRWKKGSGGRLRLSEASGLGNRGILNGSGAPDGGSNRPGMAQRALTFGPAVMAGAAAAAKPSSRRASEPSETGERGFVRVAGRKLPSVLQAGGDGYTDPREAAGGATANDDESVYYRDSQVFFDSGAGQTRLALGSPMRPVSGVVTMQPGPARTPVTESAPFPPPPPPPDSNLSPLQPPPRDPIGRTLNSQDGSRGSRGSVSRFQEDM
ncbi:hypothetical protein CkaCkLH20_01383 [Colletotrichum karsti]|uniref:Uncharacterized protein n=1 Tax=Colletotrichum karsti TaxID=1095194 RepID=A0A9P6LPK2_9PEZI|nr:uncharacterized protein CkaCkLH20_01383 [Colletotrichum karsti]KAF9881233.1 hypothetical protein CkaCkLH20_01383 [Colletotrichum karsti]